MNERGAADNYLSDLGPLILERAQAAKQAKSAAVSGETRAYEAGRLMALIEVLSLIQEQAIAFGISLDATGLQGLDPERDLL